MKVNPKIVIVEDEPTLLEALRHEFQNNDFDVSMAAAGEEGYQLIKDIKPDVVLLDLILPDVTGQEVLKRLKDDGWHHSHIVITTNLDDTSVIYECLANGASDYFIKSDVKLETIVETVQRRITGVSM